MNGERRARVKGRLSRLVLLFARAADTAWDRLSADRAGGPPQGESVEITKKSKSSFYYAFFFLPPARRQALYNVYAYCRLIDDIVDGEDSVEVKAEALSAWRVELERAFLDRGGEPAHPIALGLREGRHRFGLRYEDAVAVLDGCEMDLHTTRYATWDELRKYCYRVASAVGLLCIALFGCTDPRARDYAIHLGQALQLTNILRDIAEDAGRDRIYLPAEGIAQCGATEADLLAGRVTPGTARLVRDVARRARVEYQAAQAALPRADRRALLPAEIMGNIYFALFEELERLGPDVLTLRERFALPKKKKVAVALGTVGQALLPFRLHRLVSQLSR